MLRVALISLVLAACKDSSHEPSRESAAPAEKPTAPEPPGGPPSCPEVGAHLAAGIPVPAKVQGGTDKVQLEMSGRDMQGVMERGFTQVCRELAWSQPTRACVMGWSGDFLKERGKLQRECPGIMKK